MAEQRDLYFIHSSTYLAWLFAVKSVITIYQTQQPSSDYLIHKYNMIINHSHYLPTNSVSQSVNHPRYECAMKSARAIPVSHAISLPAQEQTIETQRSTYMYMYFQSYNYLQLSEAVRRVERRCWHASRCTRKLAELLVASLLCVLSTRDMTTRECGGL